MKIHKVIEEVEFMLTNEAKQDKRLNPIDKDVLALLQFFGNEKINQHNQDDWFPLAIRKSDKIKSLSLEEKINDKGVKVTYNTINDSINKLRYYGYIDYRTGYWNKYTKQGSLPYIKILHGTIPNLIESSSCFLDEMDCEAEDCGFNVTASIYGLDSQNGGENVSCSSNEGCSDMVVTIEKEQEKEQEKEKEKELKQEEHKVIIADSHPNETVTDNKDITNNFKFENLGKRGGGAEEEPMDAEEAEEREADGYDPDEDKDNVLPFDETETSTEGYSNNVNNDMKFTLQERKEKQADLMERWDNFLSKVNNLLEADSIQNLNNFKAEAAVYYTGEYIDFTQARMQRMYDEAIRKRPTSKAKRDRPSLPFSEDDIKEWVFECAEHGMGNVQTHAEVEKKALTYFNRREDFDKARFLIQIKVNYYLSKYPRPVEPNTDLNALPF